MAVESSAKQSARRYVFTVVSIVFLFVVGVAVANFALNPWAFNKGYVQQVAQTLQEGKHYATYDPNINWRALRREQIRIMAETPDIVVFGGSRWQEAYAELAPGKKLFNAHGHSDYAEDFFAIVQLLEEQDRLPETLVLSLRYIIFEPVEEREPTDWREWAPEYRQMSHKLGVEPHPLLQTLPTDQWFSLLSVRALSDRIQLVSSQIKSPGPTTSFTNETLDIIGADGSLRWSQRNVARFTPEFARKDARKRLERHWNDEPTIDPSLVAATEKLIVHLQSKGVKVVFAQTPFHPDFYQGMEDRPFGETLRELEALAERWEQQYGILSVGSFNPRNIGCTSDQFIDWHHAKPSCLALIFDDIPWLTTT